MRKEIRYMVKVNVTCFLLLPSKMAFAYLDPGTGSMMIQALLAVIAAISVSIGIFWRRLRSFISRFFGKKSSEENISDDN